MEKKGCSTNPEQAGSAGVKRPLLLCLLFSLVFAGLTGVHAPHESIPADGLSPQHAIILGIVEGVTEFLPISSTGHLLLTARILGVSDQDAAAHAMDTYTIVIQIGAILAVAWVYHTYLHRMLKGLFGKDPGGLHLLRNLLIAFLPSALVGFLFLAQIKQFLFGLWPVTIAWLIGGIALLIWAKDPEAQEESPSCCLETMTSKQALLIGLLQILSIWPGTSRSLVTILGGKWAGLSLKDSVIFSFLLGLITLGASTGYDFLKNGAHMIEHLGLTSILWGILAAYLSAWASVRGLVQYLKRHGLSLFGGYRIAIAGVTAVLLLTGTILP